MENLCVNDGFHKWNLVYSFQFFFVVAQKRPILNVLHLFTFNNLSWPEERPFQIVSKPFFKFIFKTLLRAHKIVETVFWKKMELENMKFILSLYFYRIEGLFSDIISDLG